MSEFFIDSLNAAAFPIIAVDGGGKVVGKNFAAYKYIPKLRLGCSIYKNAEISDDGVLTLTCESHAFKTAIEVSIDGASGEYTLYMFPTHIQNSEFGVKIKDYRGTSLSDIAKSCGAVSSPNRLYEEITEAFKNFNRSLCGCSQFCDMKNTFDLLKKRLSSGFRALGHSVRLSMTDDVSMQRFFEINVYSLVYTVMRCSYIAMRLSKNGTAEVTMDFDERTNIFTVTAASRTDKTPPQNAANAYDAISSLVPEIAIEMKMDAILDSAPSDMTCSIRDSIFKMDVMLEAKAYTELVLGSRSLGADDAVGEVFFRFAQKVRRNFKK